MKERKLRATQDKGLSVIRAKDESGLQKLVLSENRILNQSIYRDVDELLVGDFASSESNNLTNKSNDYFTNLNQQLSIKKRASSGSEIDDFNKELLDLVMMVGSDKNNAEKSTVSRTNASLSPTVVTANTLSSDKNENKTILEQASHSLAGFFNKVNINSANNMSFSSYSTSNNIEGKKSEMSSSFSKNEIKSNLETQQDHQNNNRLKLELDTTSGFRTPCTSIGMMDGDGFDDDDAIDNCKKTAKVRTTNSGPTELIPHEIHAMRRQSSSSGVSFSQDISDFISSNPSHDLLVTAKKLPRIRPSARNTNEMDHDNGPDCIIDYDNEDDDVDDGGSANSELTARQSNTYVTRQAADMKLHEACRRGVATKQDVIDILAKRPGIREKKDKSGCTPLHAYVGSVHDDDLDEDVALFSNEITHENNVAEGQQAAKRLSTARALMTPVAIQMENNSGQLPLHSVCAVGGSFETIQLLVDAAPSSIEAVDENGNTSLHLYIECFSGEKWNQSSTHPPYNDHNSNTSSLRRLSSGNNSGHSSGYSSSHKSSSFSSLSSSSHANYLSPMSGFSKQKKGDSRKDRQQQQQQQQQQQKVKKKPSVRVIEILSNSRVLNMKNRWGRVPLHSACTGDYSEEIIRLLVASDKVDFHRSSRNLVSSSAGKKTTCIEYQEGVNWETPLHRYLQYHTWTRQEPEYPLSPRIVNLLMNSKVARTRTIRHQTPLDLFLEYTKRWPISRSGETHGGGAAAWEADKQYKDLAMLLPQPPRALFRPNHCLSGLSLHDPNEHCAIQTEIMNDLLDYYHTAPIDDESIQNHHSTHIDDLNSNHHKAGNGSRSFIDAIGRMPPKLHDVVLSHRNTKAVLNGMITEPWFTAFMLLDLIIHVLLIFTFSALSYECVYRHSNESSAISKWVMLTCVYGSLGYFLFREVTECYCRGIWFYRSGWKWLDLVAVILVLWSSAHIHQDLNSMPDYGHFISGNEVASAEYQEHENFRIQLLVTNGILYLKLMSVLRNINLEFCVFLHSVICIGQRLSSFALTLGIILAAFAQMYFVGVADTASCRQRDDELTNLSFCTLNESYRKVFAMMIGGGSSGGNGLSSNFELSEPSTTLYLSLLYGIVVMILLLTVLIAVVTAFFQDGIDEGVAVFWSNRCAFVSNCQALRSLFCWTYGSSSTAAAVAPVLIEESISMGDKRHASTSSMSYPPGKQARGSFEMSRLLWSIMVIEFADPFKNANLYRKRQDLYMRWTAWQNSENYHNKYECMTALMHFSYVRKLCYIFIIPLWLLVGLITLGVAWPPQVREWLMCSKNNGVIGSWSSLNRRYVEKEQNNLIAEKQSAVDVLAVDVMKSDIKQLKKDVADMKEMLERTCSILEGVAGRV